jgi:nucleoside-diphosphate-sugar epimerase
MKILVTGASGFIGGYLVPELLAAGHDVVGIDDFSKYGPVHKAHDDHPRYRLVRGDCKDVALMRALAADCDHLVASAAMIGGIAYFHARAYDLLAENERILASTFSAALDAFRAGRLQKITVLSSSMVYECADEFPTLEGAERRSPPPRSTYGFQKLACEYWAHGAHDQYGLPYTLARPFNCVGIGERRARWEGAAPPGNLRQAMSHVVPDLIEKAVRGQDPLHLLGRGDQVRHYTYGGDLARGLRLCVEHPAALNEDFNLSTAQGHTVLEVAEAIWRRIRPGEPFRYVSDPPLPHDVLRRVPSVAKARERLGFEASTSLDAVLDEVVPWVADQVRRGTL